MRGRTRRIIVSIGVTSLLVSAVVLAAAPGAHAAGPVTEFSFTSASGDWVGSGTTKDFVPPAASFGISGTQGNVRVSITSGSEFWQVWLSAPPESQLHAGSYTDVQRASSRAPGHPGLDIFGDGHGCDRDFGTFTIDAISPTLSETSPCSTRRSRSTAKARAPLR